MALLWATATYAQQPAGPPANIAASLSTTTCPGTGCVALRISGYASLGIQVTGTWTGTLTFQGSLDGVNYQSIACTAVGPSGASVATTTANGEWTCNVGGMATVQVLVTAGPTGTAVVSLQAALAGGGSGGGGGGGAASSVTINDPSVTTQKAAVNASGQLSITCANCSGSGASAVDNSAFVAGATSGAPAMGFFHSTIDTVTDGDTAAVAIDSKRSQFGVIRDAALNNRGANVSAGNALLVDATATTQPVSGTVTANAGTNLNTSTLALEAGGHLASVDTKTPALGQALAAASVPVVMTAAQLATLTPLATVATTPPANASTNVAQINGNTTVTAGVNGLLAVGGNVANAVAATANPVPVGGIFTTTPATLTTGQTATLQFTAAQNQKNDLTTIAGTAPTTVGKLDVKGADGDVFVRQTTGTNLHAVLDTTSTTAVTQATGTNLHAVLDTTSTTAVTQATATNLNAAVVGTGTAGVPAGNILTVQGVTSMTKLLVTPDALPANQSVNTAQVNGVTTLTGTGATGTGAQRVTVATDTASIAGSAPGTAGTASTNVISVQGIAAMTKLLVTPDSVALPANQSVNVAQVNGVTTTTGAGVTGTGVQRVNDVSSAVTGAAPPAAATYVGGLQSGATGGFLGGIPVCDLGKDINVSTATTTLMVTGVSGRQVRICSFHMVTALANNVAWLEGTGATCGTGTAGMAGGTTAASGYNFAANGGIAIGSGIGQVMVTATAADSVCLITSAATQLSGFISYTIF